MPRGKRKNKIIELRNQALSRSSLPSSSGSPSKRKRDIDDDDIEDDVMMTSPKKPKLDEDSEESSVDLGGEDINDEKKPTTLEEMTVDDVVIPKRPKQPKPLSEARIANALAAEALDRLPTTFMPPSSSSIAAIAEAFASSSSSSSTTTQVTSPVLLTPKKEDDLELQAPRKDLGPKASTANTASNPIKIEVSNEKEKDPILAAGYRAAEIANKVEEFMQAADTEAFSLHGKLDKKHHHDSFVIMQETVLDAMISWNGPQAKRSTLEKCIRWASIRAVWSKDRSEVLVFIEGYSLEAMNILMEMGLPIVWLPRDDDVSKYLDESVTRRLRTFVTFARPLPNIEKLEIWTKLAGKMPGIQLDDFDVFTDEDKYTGIYFEDSDDGSYKAYLVVNESATCPIRIGGKACRFNLPYKNKGDFPQIKINASWAFAPNERDLCFELNLILGSEGSSAAVGCVEIIRNKRSKYVGFFVAYLVVAEKREEARQILNGKKVFDVVLDVGLNNKRRKE